jgi:hypothetical protein
MEIAMPAMVLVQNSRDPDKSQKSLFCWAVDTAFQTTGVIKTPPRGGAEGDDGPGARWHWSIGGQQEAKQSYIGHIPGDGELTSECS